MSMKTTNRIEAHKRIARWRWDVELFARECFNFVPDAWQRDMFRNYLDSIRSGAKACKGPGKTAGLAILAWHFMTCFDHPKVVGISVTGDNLKDGLWAEMAKWQQRSEFHKQAFTWTATRIYSNDHPETWFMSARQWSKSASKEQQADTLAGIHADNVLFLIDEAGSIPDAVVAAAEAALSTEGGTKRLVIAGNPTMLSGPLYRACTKEASLWKMIEITGDPADPKRSPRIKVEWANEQIQKYGADNPWVLVNVFGKFPPASINALLGPDDMTASMSRIIKPEAWNWAPKVLGVDVARQGDDRTIIMPRQGLVAFRPKELRIPDLMQVAGHVAQAYHKWSPDAVFVDATGGWGWGVIDKLTELRIPVTPVEFSGKSLSNRYSNKRSEMAFEAAEWIKKGGCLPNNDALKEEACALTYTFKGDKLALVEKEQIKDELGRSPDIFDALGLTFAYPVAKRDPLDAYRNEKPRGDYNPLAPYEAGRTQEQVDDYNPLGYHGG